MGNITYTSSSSSSLYSWRSTDGALSAGAKIANGIKQPLFLVQIIRSGFENLCQECLEIVQMGPSDRFTLFQN